MPLPHNASMATGSATDRLDELDGLRAIAAYAVLIYHYTYCWTPAGHADNLVAFGDVLSWIPFASVGFMGVQFFFIISGFVIFLTLNRCDALSVFLIQRIIRLWPPIVLFGTLTFVITQQWGPEQLKVGLSEYILSLLLVPPQHVGRLIGVEGWQWVDYVYWTLFVEVRFYLLIGIVYFIDRANIVRNWLAIHVALLMLSGLAFVLGSGALEKVADLLLAPHIAFFSFGIACYCAFAGEKTRWSDALALLSVVHGSAVVLSTRLGITARQDVEVVVVLVAMFALFYLFAWRRVAMPWLRTKPLVVTGQASYSTYLVHQNVGLTILAAPVLADAGVPIAALTTLGVALMVSTLAMASYTYFEVPTQRWLRSWLLGRPGRFGRQGAIQPLSGTSKP